MDNEQSMQDIWDDGCKEEPTHSDMMMQILSMDTVPSAFQWIPEDDIRHMQGGQLEDLDLINGIIDTINNARRNGINTDDAILYVGHLQHRALYTISRTDSSIYLNGNSTEFMGIPVLRVQDEFYIHLAEKNPKRYSPRSAAKWY